MNESNVLSFYLASKPCTQTGLVRRRSSTCWSWVGLWVEVDVVKHHFGCRPVDVDSTRAHWQQKDKDVGLRVAGVNQLLSEKYDQVEEVTTAKLTACYNYLSTTGVDSDTPWSLNGSTECRSL